MNNGCEGVYEMAVTVVVVGGGYGGATAAKALDDVADVVLVEPRDAFAHNVAALRAATDPEWAERIFFPYDGLLERGTVRRDRAVRVSEGSVELASGAVLAADYVVLATGSAHRYPAKIDVLDSAAGKAKLARTHRALAQASGVLLLGAGPVGLEFAGEIKAAWPDKEVTIIDPAPDLLAGRQFPAAFAAELRAQLDALGVTLLLGTSLPSPPPTAPGEPGAFSAAAESGDTIRADIWFACYGATADAGYLGPDLRAALRPDGTVAVTPSLRLPGSASVFAIGDVTALPEMKQARAAQKHAEVAAANIRSLIAGGDVVATYEPAPDAIVLPLGPKGGVSYAPEAGVLGPDVTADLKSGDLFVDVYREMFGLRQPLRWGMWPTWTRSPSGSFGRTRRSRSSARARTRTRKRTACPR
jgi:apoptosis-inducing factor 2